MLFDPVDNGDGTQMLKYEGEFWACSWFEGSNEIIHMTWDDGPVNKPVHGKPPRAWSGVFSFINIEIEGVTRKQLGKGATTWEELDQFITDKGLIRPEREIEEF